MTTKQRGPHSEKDNKALMAAIAISLCILLGFHFGYERPRQENARIAAAQQVAQKPVIAKPEM